MKMKVAIIGTGNIGTDLLLKLQRSEYLECTLFTGRNPDSKGIAFANKLGVKTAYNSINAIIEDPNCCDIVFDATSANVHRIHAPILKDLKKFVIDMTPAKISKFCVPVINMEECLKLDNVNLITCGGQAAVPIAYALSQVQEDITYIELVASIASKSAGSGTRSNIDEFTQTTRDALSQFSNVKNTKAIIILNPAEPPIIMRNTIYALVDNPDMLKITKAVLEMESEIKKYVPGYSITCGPIFEDGRIVITVQVIGSGDFLPSYSGNLDIINCAGIRVAEEFAKKQGRSK